MKFQLFKPQFECMSNNFGSGHDFLSMIFEPSKTDVSICEEDDKKIPMAIVIFGCATIPKYKQEILTIQETWGLDAKRAGIPYYFILGEEPTDLQCPEFIYLTGVDNTYESAKYKQFLGHLEICKRHNPDIVFICGTDTFVNIPKLIQASQTFNPEVPYLIGNDGFHKQFGPLDADFLSGGGGLLTTRAANRLLIPYCLAVCQSWTDACTIFRSDLSAASDVILSFLAHYLKISFVQVYSFYHVSWKSVDAVQGPIRIKDITTCHMMSRQDCLEFYEVLRANKYFLV